jgi:hypothetical protein
MMMNYTCRLKRFLGPATAMALLVLVLLGGPLTALGQTSTGAIEGEVTDAQGKYLSGAKVTVRQPATNLTREAQTSDGGLYRFDSLPVGVYEVRVESGGFQPKILTGVVVEIGQVVRLDATLEIGKVSDAITIEAQAPLVEASTPTIGEVIDNRQIEDLPLNGRNFLQLGLLASGTAPAAEGGTTATYGTASGDLGFSVGGGRDTWNNFTLDGITILEQVVRTISMDPSIDAIQEFKVVHNTYSAEQGGTPGAQVNLTTKSGANAFHGTMYEFLRNDIFDARNFFDPSDKPGYRQNQFGAALGGPIKRDRTFFFINYEGLRIRQGITSDTLLPTAAIRDGDLAGINPGTGQPFPTITNPLTGQPFPGNRIPVGQINPVSQAILNLIPLPNIAGAGPGQNNYVNLDTKRVQTDQFTARIDQKINDRNQFFARFTLYDSTQFVPFTQNTTTFNPQAPPGFGDNQDDYSRNFAAGLTTVISPTLINDLRGGYNRINNFREAADINRGFLNANGLQEALPGVQQGVPDISVPGFASMGDADIFQPLNRLNNTFQVTDGVTWVKGKHTIKFGVDEQLTYAKVDFDAFSQGEFLFSDGVESATGSAWSDFLLGRPFFSFVGEGTSNHRTRFNYLGLYFNDEFRVTHKLTLTYGLRYDLPQPPRATDGMAAAFDPQNGDFVVAPVNGMLPVQANNPIYKFYEAAFGTKIITTTQAGVPNDLTPMDWKDIGPRIGIAYDLFGNGRTVFRAAYGIYSAPREFLTTANDLTSVPPYSYLATDLDLARLGVPVPPATYQSAYAGGNGAPSGGTVNINGIDGYSEQYTADIQQQIGSNLLLELTYAGSTSIHINHFAYINQPLPNLPGQRRGVAPFPTTSPLLGEADDVTATYHSGTIRMEKRLRTGLSLNAFYTYSKAIDNSSSVAETAGSATVAQDAYDDAAEKGLAAFDIRNRFVANAIWEVPLGKGHHLLSEGAGNAVLGDWQLAGILNFQSGQPLTPVVGNGLSGTNASEDRPDRICDGNLPAGQRNPNHWFDTSCFVSAPLFFDAQGPYSIPGNSGRNIIIGPGYQDFDFAAQKKFTFSERQGLLFRWEVFNLANHPNFDLPGRQLNTSDFGVVTSAKNSRQMQFSLRYSF